MPRVLCQSYRCPGQSAGRGCVTRWPRAKATQRCVRAFLAFNSVVLAVETLSPEGFRGAFFRTTAALGVAKMVTVFLDGATP